jgi:hypothetical protein
MFRQLLICFVSKQVQLRDALSTEQYLHPIALLMHPTGAAEAEVAVSNSGEHYCEIGHLRHVVWVVSWVVRRDKIRD